MLDWEKNEAVLDILSKKSQPIVQRYNIAVSEGFYARVKLLIPPYADLTGATKYPMLIFV